MRLPELSAVLFIFGPDHATNIRNKEDERVMVVLNNSPEERTLALGRYAEGLKGFNNGIDILSGSTINLERNLKIDGKTRW